MFGWGFRRERLVPGELGEYAQKIGIPATQLLSWLTKLNSILSSQHSFFKEYFSFLLNPMLDVCNKYNVHCLDSMPGFPAVFVTTQYCSAGHYDLDFSWSFCVWYNKKTPKIYHRKIGNKKVFIERPTVAEQSGGHFFMPSLGSAFKLDSPSTCILFHGSRHCHGTTLYTQEGMVRLWGLYHALV